MPVKICVVTGGRADYGLLSMPMKAIQADADLSLQIIATGQHLSDSQQTLQPILQDGFRIDAVVDMNITGDDATSLTEAAGRELAGLAVSFGRLQPDIVMLLGDRYEILAAAYAALIARIPVAHLCGGDVTEGAFDDSIRHAITKLAHLHFPTNELSGQRILQMGEDESRVHVVGSPGIDAIKAVETVSRQQFFAEVGLRDQRPTFLITLHPATLSSSDRDEGEELLAALSSFGPQANFLFTGVNCDPGSSRIAAQIRDFVARTTEQSCFRQSLGSQLYFSALKHSDLVVGNSSSGLYEAPSFGIATVNIGDRQTGRLKARSVFDAAVDRTAILAAIQEALMLGLSNVENPYGDGRASERIVNVLKAIGDPKVLLHKRFSARGIA